MIYVCIFTYIIMYIELSKDQVHLIIINKQKMYLIINNYNIDIHINIEYHNEIRYYNKSRGSLHFKI